KRDPETGDVTLDDGRRFGTQVLAEGKKIYVQKFEEAPTGEAEFAPEEKPAPPKLRPGEKAGELLQGADQPFNLMGEQGTDAGRIAAEKAKAVQTAVEAKALEQKQQQQLPGTEGISVGPGAASPGDVPPPPPIARVKTGGSEAPHDKPLGAVSPLGNWMKNAWTEITNIGKGFLGHTLPRITKANRQVGESGARYLSSRIAARPLAATFSSHVLQDTGVDPVKFGAALTEDNLTSI